MSRKLEVEIIGTDKLSPTLRGATDDSNRFGSALGNLAKTAGIAAGAAGLGAIAITLKQGIGEWVQSTKVTAQTEAVLKSTGGQAHVTAKQVDDLAGSILRKTGIDDEATKSGENLLLTFTGIRNEVGKGNDIFDQATRAMTDMSVALGQDTKSSAIQLGKALNDPIKGITALRRVGVSFTDDQKEQIKTLVESGKTMQAQKLILGELTKEFGGSAEAVGKTLPGQISILKESFNNLAGDIVGHFVPAFTGTVSFLTEKGIPAISGLADRIGSTLKPMFDAVLPVIKSFGEIFSAAVQKIGGVVQQHMPEIRTIIENVGKVLRNVAEIVMPLIKLAFEVVLPTALRIAIPVLQLITGIIADVTGALKTVFKWIGDVVEKLTGVPGLLKSAFSAVGGALATLLKAPINAVIDAWNSIGIPSFHVHIPIPFAPDINFDTPGIGLPDIPHLDTGGYVAETGLAVVHRGETYSGVGRSLGGDLHFHFNGPVVAGGDKRAIARELAEAFWRELQETGRLRGGLGFA